MCTNDNDFKTHEIRASDFILNPFVELIEKKMYVCFCHESTQSAGSYHLQPYKYLNIWHMNLTF